MIKSRTNQYTISQANHTPSDAVPLHERTIKYTVKCHPLSPNNLIVGINEDPNEGNLLQPGESMTIGANTGYYVADKLYLGFELGGTNQGKALVVVEIDLNEEACKEE